MTESASTITEDITQQKEAEDERSRLLTELQDAVASVKQLEELLSVYASCKKIHDGQGQWVPIEIYSAEFLTWSFRTAIAPSAQKVFKINGKA